MKASVIKVDVSGVKPKIAKIKSDKGLGNFAAEEAERLMQQYVPFRSSALMHSARAKDWKVTYTTPYARKQYFDNRMRHPRGNVPHPLAVPKWDKKIDKDQLAQAITRYLKRS